MAKQILQNMEHVSKSHSLNPRPPHSTTNSYSYIFMEKEAYYSASKETLSPKQPHPPKFKEILMMEEMFIYQRRPGA